MSRIRNKNTKPEEKIRKLLWSNGIRYRLHCKDLPGKPDLVFKGKKKVVFINGCFWHKHDCHYFKWPKSNAEFWRNKIESTVCRDQDNYRQLTKLGWEFMVIWECETKAGDLEPILKRIRGFLEG